MPDPTKLWAAACEGYSLLACRGAYCAAAGAGFLMGLQHATDADHVVAVSTIAAQSRRASSALAVGAFWGAGHTLTLGAAGLVILALSAAVPESLARGFEFTVGAALVAVGVAALVRGGPAAWGSVKHAHEHGHDERHGHHLLGHGPHSHEHLHLPQLEVLAAQSRRPWRSFGLGMVHGLAGSSGLSLAFLAALPGPAAAAGYLCMYGLGTLAGMAALSCAFGYCAIRLSAAASMGRWLVPGLGAVSVAFGLTMMAAP